MPALPTTTIMTTGSYRYNNNNNNMMMMITNYININISSCRITISNNNNMIICRYSIGLLWILLLEG